MSVNIKQNGELVKISGLYNAYNGAPDYYVETTQTLSTSEDTTFTFTDENIHSSSAVSPYASIFGMNPKSMTISEGQCVVVFPSYSEAVAMSCRLYIKSSGTGSNSPTNYSTEKVAVGTWIDGRTVYQQTFVKEVTQTGVYNFSPLPFIDMCVSCQGFYDVKYKYNDNPHNSEYLFDEYSGGSSTVYVYLTSMDFSSRNYSYIGVNVNYFPTSSQYATISDVDAKLYLTIQFVEVES